MNPISIVLCSFIAVMSLAEAKGTDNLRVVFPSWKVCIEDIFEDTGEFTPESCDCEPPEEGDTGSCCDTPSGGEPIRKFVKTDAYFCLYYSKPPDSRVFNGRISFKSFKPKLGDYYFLRVKNTDERIVEKILYHTSIDCLDVELSDYYKSSRKHSVEDLSILAGEKLNCILKSDCDQISRNINLKKQKQIGVCRAKSDTKLYVRATREDLNP